MSNKLCVRIRKEVKTERYMRGSKLFVKNGSKPWEEVDLALARELEKVTTSEGNLNAPKLFQIETPERAKEISALEAKGRMSPAQRAYEATLQADQAALKDTVASQAATIATQEQQMGDMRVLLAALAEKAGIDVATLVPGLATQAQAEAAAKPEAKPAKAEKPETKPDVKPGRVASKTDDKAAEKPGKA